MDVNNQAGVAGHFDPETLDYLLNGLPTGKPVRMVLRRNCRNTREIVRYVQLWTGADIGITEVSGNGGPPQLLKANEEDVPVVLATSIRKVLDDGARPEDIGLVFEDDEYAAKQIVERLSSDIQRFLVQLNPLVVAHELTGRILWGSAKRFKGLERPIVFAIALDAHSVELEESQFYVAVTRANYALYVVASPERAARISADMERNLTAVSLRGS